jgi:hypothetical protein
MVVVVAVVSVDDAGGAGGTVPCGSRVSVYRVPSAVFTSVTGVFTFSVNVAAPLEYEPPATATFAVDSVRATSWNAGLAAGKFEPVVTDSLVPLTEMTAEVGGGVGGAGGVFGGLLGVACLLGVDDFVPVAVELGPPALNGSLLSKSENDCSWPVPAEVGTASTSCDEPLGVAAVVFVGSEPPSVGAAGSGVVAVGATGVEPVVETAPTCGFDDELPPELSDIIVCTAYAPAAASTTMSPIAIFFCFSAFALAASATFLRATSSPLLPTNARWRCQPTRLAPLWSSRPSTYHLLSSARAPQ